MEIIITGFSASLADSQKARAVPLNELPQLNDEQKEVARKFEMFEEDYARQVLAFQYGGARLQAGAAKLACVIGERLRGLVPGVGPFVRIQTELESVGCHRREHGRPLLSGGSFCRRGG